MLQLEEIDPSANSVIACSSAIISVIFLDIFFIFECLHGEGIYYIKNSVALASGNLQKIYLSGGRVVGPAT